MANDITDLYQQIFGRINIRDGSVVEMAEHGRVGGVSTGAGFKRVVGIDPATGQAIGATLSIAGPLTIASLPTLSVFQGGSWNINATVYGNFGATPTLTDVNLAKVAGATITLGQATSTQSLPVVLALDQTSVPVVQSGIWNVNATVSGSVDARQSGIWSVNATVSGALDVRQLGQWAVNQTGSWIVNASIPNGVSVNNTVPVSQSGAWGVTATIANFLSVQSLPTLTVFQGGTWNLVASLPGEVEIKNDAGNPIPTYLTTLPSLTVISNQGGQWSVFATSTIANAVSIQSLPTLSVLQGSAWNVTATIGNIPSVSIASLPSLTVIANQGGNWVINASIPNGVTVNNPSLPVTQSGAWAVTATTTIANTVPVSQSGVWNVTATIGNTLSAAISSLPSLTVIANQGGVWNVFATISGMLTARAEDAAHTTADFGQFILGVRNDFASLATMTSNNLDYSPFAVDDKGRIEVAPSIGALANGVETLVTGTAIAVLNANVNRTAAIIQNTGAANVRIGVAGLSTTTGFRLVPGGHFIYENPFVPTATLTAIREGATNSTIFAQEIT